MPGEPPPAGRGARVRLHAADRLARLHACWGRWCWADGTGLAAVAGQSGESRVVRVGEEIDGFRLTRVGNGTATLQDGDTTLVLETHRGAP